MHAPIIILSFNRPIYLKRVLESLLTQDAFKLNKSNVHLFQDGSKNIHSGWVHAKEEDIIACCDMFRSLFPEGTIHKSESNLGVALNFERAERFAFEEVRSDFAIFLEDDLVLGPYYMSTMQKLSSLALARDDVGYFAAYGAHRFPLSAQKMFANDLIALEHNWGFGLTKQQWIKSSPYIDQYLELVRNKDYRDRPHDKIKALFSSWGAAMPGSSQDVAKTIACQLTGSVKINTLAVFGKYIGEKGLHFNSEVYEKLGYGKSEVLQEDIFTRNSISEFEIEQFRSVLKTFVKTGASRAPQSVESRLLALKLLGQNPYDGFVASADGPVLHGWNGDHHALTKQVMTNRPRIIVDVGAWLGQSTSTLARAQSHVAQDGTVIAVDTFLGSPEHWSVDREDTWDLMRFTNGRPDFYATFLSNMVLLGLSERVFPLAQTSIHAAALLKKHGVKANLVHLDAHHTYNEVLRDMEVYWDIIEPGGVLMGDDFQFPGVSRAVVHFSDQHSLDYSIEFPKWSIKKPSSQ